MVHWWTDIEIWEMIIPKVQYFTLYLTRCPKSNCYLSNNISKEALFRAIFDHCPSFEITSLKMYFLNLYLIFRHMKIQFVSFLQNLIIFAFSNFWETSQSNTHKLLQGLNRLHFLKNRNSKWSWNEWIKKILFLFQVEFQFISNISFKTIHVIVWTSAMLYHWWIQNKKNFCW